MDSAHETTLRGVVRKVHPGGNGFDLDCEGRELVCFCREGHAPELQWLAGARIAVRGHWSPPFTDVFTVDAIDATV